MYKMPSLTGMNVFMWQYVLQSRAYDSPKAAKDHSIEHRGIIDNVA